MNVHSLFHKQMQYIRRAFEEGPRSFCAFGLLSNDRTYYTRVLTENCSAPVKISKYILIPIPWYIFWNLHMNAKIGLLMRIFPRDCQNQNTDLKHNCKRSSGPVSSGHMRQAISNELQLTSIQSTFSACLMILLRR